MTRPALILDVSRAISRADHPAPTGIDRVDAAYRRHALAQSEWPVFALAWMRRRVWMLDRAGLAALDAMLAQPAEGGSRSLFSKKPQAVQAVEALVAQAAVDRTAPVRAGGMAAAYAPGGRYLNTSHSASLAHGLAPLAAAGIRIGALIHDALPLDRPEFFHPDTPPLFEAKLRSVFAYADALIANSQATAARLRHWAQAWGLSAPEILVAPLGVEARPSLQPASQADPPVFVMLGTIEPRKNHLLLLHVWRRLFDRLGPARCPHLHLVGRRGWECENVLDILDRSPMSGVVIHERGALDEAALAALMAHASALLAPSIDEGFGLPVAEALAQGVPVLAADIPAHREAGGEGPDYLDPLDGPAWEAAVLEFAQPASTHAAAARARAARYAPPGWDAHFRAVDAFLQRREAAAVSA